MTAKKKRKKVAGEWIPSNDQIRCIYQQGDSRSRALLLVLYQGGFSEIDVLSLDIEHLLNIQTHEGHYPLMLHKEKTDFMQRTFISEEAVRDIREMLRERGNPQLGPLFLSQKGKRMNSRSINKIVKNMVKKAYGEDQSKKFKIRNLRSAYDNAVLRSKLTKDVKDALLGNKRDRDRDRHPISEASIVEAYNEAFKYLTVNHGTQASKDIERLDNAINKLVKKLNEKDKEIKTLKGAIEHIRDSFLEQTEKDKQHLTETRQQLDSIKEAFQAFLKRIQEKNVKTVSRKRE